MKKRNRKSVESTPAIETPVVETAVIEQPIVETQPAPTIEAVSEPIVEQPAAPAVEMPIEPVVEPAAAEQPKLTAEEQAFKGRYPQCDIVPNTLGFSGTPKFAGKRTAMLVDVHNGEHVERATSDFHTWTGYGPKTIKIYRKAAKTLKKANAAQPAQPKVNLDEVTVEMPKTEAPIGQVETVS
jgi:hypothetical protein